MLTTFNVHFIGNASVDVNEDASCVVIRDNGDLFAGVTLFFRDNDAAHKVAAVLREACNPRQAAEERAPSPTPHILAAASEPFLNRSSTPESVIAPGPAHSDHGEGQ